MTSPEESDPGPGGPGLDGRISTGDELATIPGVRLCPGDDLGGIEPIVGHGGGQGAPIHGRADPAPEEAGDAHAVASEARRDGGLDAVWRKVRLPGCFQDEIPLLVQDVALNGEGHFSIS